MVLFPNKPKFLKPFLGKFKNKIMTKKIEPTQANFVLVAAQSGLITNFQIEAIKKYLRRFVKKQAQLFVKVFPTNSITKKPLAIRLGRGKADVKYWTTIVKSGCILIEVNGSNEKLINYHLNHLKHKLPIKTNVYFTNFWWIL